MIISAIAIALIDNGGRRSGFERRQFSYTNHIPERRIAPKRRILFDRRQTTDRRYLVSRRMSGSDKGFVKNMMGLKCRRKKQERRSDYERRAAFAAVLAPP